MSLNRVMNPPTSRRRDIDDDLSSIQRVRGSLDSLDTHLALCGVEYREQRTENRSQSRVS